jgi:hypothetical protein
LQYSDREVEVLDMDDVFPLLGLAGEWERLRQALRNRESLLVTGAAGAGKTALIRAAIAEHPTSRDILQIGYSANLHSLLLELTRGLLKADHKVLRARAKPGANVEKWLFAQTSAHLKGLLWTSLEAAPLTIVLDGINGASFPMYRFLQRLYFARGMAIIATARDTGSLGALSRLFWDPRSILQIRPLNHADSERLFGLAAKRFGLEHLDLDDFREKVLESAHGNPGEIVEMCRLASNPLYVSGTHIKFAPLRIDVMMRFLPVPVMHRAR